MPELALRLTFVVVGGMALACGSTPYNPNIGTLDAGSASPAVPDQGSSESDGSSPMDSGGPGNSDAGSPVRSGDDAGNPITSGNDAGNSPDASKPDGSSDASTGDDAASDAGTTTASAEVFMWGVADPDNPTVALQLNEIAFDATNIYVLAAGIKSYLIQRPRNGGQAGSLYSVAGSLHGLAIDAQYAYLYNGSRLVKVWLAGGIALDFAAGPYPIVANADHVFWSGANNTIFGEPKAGGSVASIQQDPRGSSPIYLAADQDTLYWTNLDGIVRAPAVGGAITQVAQTAGGPFAAMAVDNTQLYFVSSCNIKVVPKTGGTPQMFVPGSCDPLSPNYLAVDDTYLMWTTPSGVLVRAKKM